MAAPAPPRIVIDGDDGSSLAVATIDIIDLDVVRASLHVNPGHLPPGTRARLVDAVLDDPDVACRRQVQFTLPLGDTEILDRLRERGDGAGEPRAERRRRVVTERRSGGPTTLDDGRGIGPHQRGGRLVVGLGGRDLHRGGGAAQVLDHGDQRAAGVPDQRPQVPLTQARPVPGGGGDASDGVGHHGGGVQEGRSR